MAVFQDPSCHLSGKVSGQLLAQSIPQDEKDGRLQEDVNLAKELSIDRLIQKALEEAPGFHAWLSTRSIEIRESGR